MGYRSVWRLAFSGKPEKLNELTAWMRYMCMEEKEASFTVDGFFRLIIDSETLRSDNKLEFSDDYTKCYDPWDLVISKIKVKAEALGLDCAYARIGEDNRDVESYSSGSLYIPIYTSMDETQY